MPLSCDEPDEPLSSGMEMTMSFCVYNVVSLALELCNVKSFDSGCMLKSTTVSCLTWAGGGGEGEDILQREC
jgi:hypothetical protein